jgi:chromate transport protein ChrA
VALPFWISIGALSTVQGALVAVPRARGGSGDPAAGASARGRRRLPRVSRWWALLPAGSVLAFVFGVRAAGGGTQVLTYLALVAVPPLAAVALAFLTPGAAHGGAHGALRSALRAAAAAALFALAWADRGALAGELAAVALTALSCVTLGVAIAAITPPAALAAGIVAMAAADSALVISDLLQRPNNALNLAHPAAGLPRLQSALFGSAVMGYGDLFVAGLLGGLLALHASRGRQLAAAVLAVCAALAFDLLFFAVNELPATVPIAAVLLLGAGWGRVWGRGRGPRGEASRGRGRALGETAPEQA